MTRYRSKPVEIEARQWEGTPEAATPIINWVLGHGGTARWHEAIEAVYDEEGEMLTPKIPEGIYISTLEGIMHAKPGDWIIRGTENEFYPCIDSVFRRKYEPVTTKSRRQGWPRHEDGPGIYVAENSELPPGYEPEPLIKTQEN